MGDITEGLKTLIQRQLTEQEITIFLLVEGGGMSYRAIGHHLLMDHTQVSRIYNRAVKKLQAQQ